MSDTNNMTDTAAAAGTQKPPRNLRQAVDAVGGGVRSIVLRFVLPLAVVALLIIIVHSVAGLFGVDMSGQKIARYFWLLLIVGGVGAGFLRRKK